MTTPPQTPGEAAREAFYKAAVTDPVKLTSEAAEMWDAAAKAAIEAYLIITELELIQSWEDHHNAAAAALSKASLTPFPRQREND